MKKVSGGRHLTEPWIPLTEYSNKYHVSISTLRRRIKSGSVEVKTVDGKYHLRDIPIDGGQVSSLSELRSAAPTSQREEPRLLESRMLPLVSVPSLAETKDPSSAFSRQLLDELKAAYQKVSEEKEKQILLLREEISDLKTLVRVLEDENRRLREETRTAPLDSWLDEIRGPGMDPEVGP